MASELWCGCEQFCSKFTNVKFDVCQTNEEIMRQTDLKFYGL